MSFEPDEAVTLPREGRLAGIDYGTVRIGIALSDPLQILASPAENYTRGTADADAEFFRELKNEESILWRRQPLIQPAEEDLRGLEGVPAAQGGMSAWP